MTRVFLGAVGAFQKANLHTHTTRSDGAKTPEETVGVYREAGYDVLAITDHWKLSRTEMVGRAGGGQTAHGMLCLGGIEFDTPQDEGSATTHIVALGIEDARGYDGLPPADIIHKVHFEGGLAIVAHPHWSLMSEAGLLALAHADAFEIYNGLSFDTHRGDASALIDGMIARGASPRLCACDDTHFFTHDVGVCYTMIDAPDNREGSVMDALRAGRFYASQGPRFERVALEDGVLEVRCCGAEYALFLSAVPWVPGRRVVLAAGVASYSPLPEEAFIRVVIVDEAGRCASTGSLDVRQGGSA